MPELDGYQATAALRADARFASLPIIAMTAHATVEERQRCLAAGMNDHVAKPIDPRVLIDTVARFRPPGQPAEAGVQAIAGIDTRDGLSRVGGNQALYLKLLRQFAEQQGDAAEQIRRALDSSDHARGERIAHALKGVAGNLGASGVQSTAAALEALIRDRAAADHVEAARLRVAGALDPVVAAVRAAVEPIAPPEVPVPPASSAPANAFRSREAAARLRALLTDLDPTAADFVEANRAALEPLIGREAWAGFERLVQEYAFADAQARLEEALRSFALA